MFWHSQLVLIVHPPGHRGNAATVVNEPADESAMNNVQPSLISVKNGSRAMYALTSCGAEQALRLEDNGVITTRRHARGDDFDAGSCACHVDQPFHKLLIMYAKETNTLTKSHDSGPRDRPAIHHRLYRNQCNRLLS